MNPWLAQRLLKQAVTMWLLLGMAIGVAATASAAETKILAKPKPISQHAYAWIGPLEGPNKANHGYRMNLGFVVGKAAVAVIDSGYTQAMAKEMVSHIQRITQVPIRFVINTNSQPHRFMGNDVFHALGAQIIMHEKEAQRAKKRGSDFAFAIESILGLPKDSVSVPKPANSVISQETTVDLGGVTLHVIPLGATHTPGQLVVKVSEDQVVYAGDTLYSGRLLAVLNDSHVKSWIQAYDSLQRFGDVTFVPGHGEPNRLAAFDFPTRQYLQMLYDHMANMVGQEVDGDEAIRRLDQSAYQHLVNFDELAGRNASWTFLQVEQELF